MKEAIRAVRLLLVGLLALSILPASWGVALSIPEGWQLVAQADQGDRGALERLIQAYQAQDPEAATALGVLYLNGVVYPRDLTRAKEYFEWAHARGSAWAPYWLAVLYANGLGVPRDTQTATRYASTSGERGYVGGKLTVFLLQLVLERKLKYEDFTRLVEAETAKAPDDPVSLGFRGRLAMDKAYAAKNPEEQGRFLAEAREFYRKAAEGGHYIYRDLYLPMLYFGLGGEPDQKKALELARPLGGFGPNATGLLVWDLYFGNVQSQNRPQACELAGKYFAYPDLRADALRTVYGLCLMDGGKRVDGYAHILKAAASGFASARAIAKERERALSKEEVERAKALLKDLP